MSSERRYVFHPWKDITAIEVARILELMLVSTNPETWETMAPEVRRHFWPGELVTPDPEGKPS